MIRAVPRQRGFASLAAVKHRSLTFRMIMALCVVNLLLAQMMGLHFHRHVTAGVAGPDMSLHLRDAGMHVHAEADGHHAAADRASHPDEDVEVDPLGTGVAKFSKVWLAPPLLLIVTLCLLALVLAAPTAFESLTRRHPALFFLRPPSNAPPLKPLSI
jgi:hypothetical protein